MAIVLHPIASLRGPLALVLQVIVGAIAYGGTVFALDLGNLRRLVASALFRREQV
jgi:hypothetical protein